MSGKSTWSGVMCNSITEVHWEFVAQTYHSLPHAFLLSLTEFPLKLISFPEKILTRKHFIHIFVDPSILLITQYKTSYRPTHKTLQLMCLKSAKPLRCAVIITLGQQLLSKENKIVMLYSLLSTPNTNINPFLFFLFPSLLPPAIN